MVMPTCLLDLGNTRYKWLDANDIASVEACKRPYAADNTEAELVADVLGQSGCKCWVVASVRGEAFNQTVAAAFKGGGGTDIRFVSIPPVPPFVLAYQNRCQFGIDRYLNLLAAREKYPLPLIVIDAGTAVTIDVLDQAGNHVGGAIFPGLALLRRSLGQGTDLITANEEMPAKLLGDSTASCVSGGVWYGFHGALRGIVDGMRQTLSGHATIVATGGDAGAVAAAFPADAPCIDSSLLFEGLSITLSCAI